MGTNYEGKLGEWLKYVQQQIEAAGTKNKEEEKEHYMQHFTIKAPIVLAKLRNNAGMIGAAVAAKRKFKQ